MIRLRVILGTSAAVLAVAGCGTTVPNPVLTPAPTVSTIVAAGVDASPAPPTPAPVAIDVPSIHVTSSLIPLDLVNGAIDPPSVHNPEQAGWYVRSAPPGDPGAAVILGHVDGDHIHGVFYRLKKVTIGATVAITQVGGSVLIYRVYRTASVSKSQFPFGEVFDHPPTSEIRLVTCGGVFDRAAKSYENNIIVWAK